MTLNKILNIALPKGRILDAVLPILFKVGIEPEKSFFDRDDRRLKFKTNINNLCCSLKIYLDEKLLYLLGYNQSKQK